MSLKCFTQCSCSSKEPMYFMYAKCVVLKAITSKWNFLKHCLLISAFCTSIKDTALILQCTAPCDNIDPEGHHKAWWISVQFNGYALTFHRAITFFLSFPPWRVLAERLIYLAVWNGEQLQMELPGSFFLLRCERHVNCSADKCLIVLL